MSTTVPPDRPTIFSTADSGSPLQQPVAVPGPTPTEQVVAKANAKPKIVTKVDERGRRITVKFLSPLDRMRLAKLLGKDAGNEVYMGYAALAFAVTHIDEDDTSIANIRELEFLVERLGDEGLQVVGDIYQTDFAGFIKAADLDTAKN